MPIETKDKIRTFWVKWLQAGELEQLELVTTLMLPTNTIKDKKIYRHHAASIMQAYLEDFAKAIASMSASELTTYLAPYKTSPDL